MRTAKRRSKPTVESSGVRRVTLMPQGESWTKEDWQDLLQTIELFKRRVRNRAMKSSKKQGA